MTDAEDARIPILFAPSLAAGLTGCAVLLEGDQALPEGVAGVRFTARGGRHGAGCACCRPRSPAAEALARLFLARARGEAAPFSAIVAVTTTPAGRAAVLEALEADVLARARFRLAG